MTMYDHTVSYLCIYKLPYDFPMNCYPDNENGMNSEYFKNFPLIGIVFFSHKNCTSIETWRFFRSITDFFLFTNRILIRKFCSGEIRFRYDRDITEAAQFRHAALSRLPGSNYDIQIFGQLPLYVRIEVLKGTPVFIRNPEFLYETANRTLRDFDDFKHRLYDYTGHEAISWKQRISVRP